ncbi:methyltransferase [Tenacibaculum finnmarkense]|uniref:methyltransferase n=1 Tax=Tenacibaculum finnmarkense TaxID=2781243 RepID=UPI00187BA473|nr:methyltransferase [Tenacibaculum finnmarkense]MBE7692490.1 methyltransferase [Tenacibaculum finnmarkense genomovar finnmarkense]MCD8446873.1 methyltransferase [Tenacibaculum finnmarkense genomovar finnmarkense]MCG8804834.1 methyltransferase [Tenacibaculum finnmarkense]MCG8856332.1 methyltransferase [Tenacibaculum finnmarkense]WCC47941.1 methyltransferase [Tenacibaculum finnmarkense]
MITDIKINKPTPIAVDKTIKPYKGGTNIRATIETLEAGKYVLITGLYSNGLTLLEELHKYLKRTLPNKTFEEQRAYRAKYQALSNLVLVEIADHKLVVRKSPSIGWFEKFYPENTNYLLTFPQVQGLNSAWQWYLKGLTIPVLRNKIHPYYGTYFPTRFEHLYIFDKWLSKYEGAKKSAVDVGIGCGVLSFQMVKHGFQKVFGTDTNPNAIAGLSEFMGETKLSRKIELDFGHLFGNLKKQTELIVFNPPWLPKLQKGDAIDKAIYYDEDLFPEFFEQAKERLLPDGKLLLLFSNLAEITNVTEEHPIKNELANGGRFQLEKCYTKPVKRASEITKRNQHWRSLEEVQLWVLTHK